MSVTVLSQPVDDGTSRRLDNLEQELDETKEQLDQTEQATENAKSAANVALSVAADASPGLTRDDVTSIIDERFQPLLTELEEWRRSQQQQTNQSAQQSTPSIDPPGNSDDQPSANDLTDTGQNVTLETEQVPTLPKPKGRFRRMLFHRK